MTRWLSEHGQALALVIRQQVRTPFASMLTLLAIGVAISLPAGLYALLENLGVAVGSFQGSPQITLVLAPSANADTARQIEARLAKIDGIRDYRFISRDQGLKELAQSSGIEEITAGLTKNPLPDVFTVRATSGVPGDLAKLRDELAQLPKVEAALLDAAWVKRLHALIGLGRNAVAILALLLGVALVAITSNTIRLQILSRRDEIEVSKLIGATDTFVRRPFLYHGALQGLVGGAVAWAIVAITFHFLNAGIGDLSRFYAFTFRLNLPPPHEALALLGFSALLGWLGAFFSVSQHLRQIEPRL